MKYLKNALLISLGASFIDQIYHFMTHIGHSVIENTADPTTWLYVFSKFIIFFVVAYLVLKFLKGIIIQSIAIGAIGAILFAIALNYLIPAQYNIILHLAHFAAGLVAAFLILHGEKQKWNYLIIFIYMAIYAIIISFVGSLYISGYG